MTSEFNYRIVLRMVILTGIIFHLSSLNAQSDKLDLGFSDDGIGMYALIPDFFFKDALVDDNNNLIYFLNWPEENPVYHYMLRVLPNGNPDISLGPDGIIELPDFNIDDPCDEPFEELCHKTTRIVKSAGLSDGRIVVGGETTDFDEMFRTWFIAVILPDGTLDSTFNENGVMFGPYAQKYLFTGLGTDDDNNILFSCYDNDGENSEVYKITPEGNFDVSFGTAGQTILEGVDFNCLEPIKLDAVGNIYLGGKSYVGGDLFRLTPDGQADITFGDGGAIPFDVSSFAIESFNFTEDHIYAAGELDPMYPVVFYLMRFNYDGILDETFSIDGLIACYTDTVVPCPEFISDNSAVNEFGEFFISLNYNGVESGTPDIFILNYTPDGELDTSFSETGVTYLNGGYPRDVNLDKTGKLIVTISDSLNILGVYRLNTDATVTGLETNAPCSFDEICNGIDDNGNLEVDEGLAVNYFFADADGDNYGNIAVDTMTCMEAIPGFVPDSTDCDDTNPTIYPGADEIADSLDNNCNGIIDEGIAVGIVVDQMVTSHLAVFPNPSTGAFTVTTKSDQHLSMVISNISGQVVFKQIVKQEDGLINESFLLGIPAGLYFIHLFSDELLYTGRLIIQ